MQPSGGGKKDIPDQIQRHIACVHSKYNNNCIAVLTCSAMMPNSPKHAYCTKFLLRMRTQPPVDNKK